MVGTRAGIDIRALMIGVPRARGLLGGYRDGVVYLQKREVICNEEGEYLCIQQQQSKADLKGQKKHFLQVIFL